MTVRLDAEVEFVMISEDGEKWRELCAEAANEKDPAKLHELTQEINRLLKLREERLSRIGDAAAAPSADRE